MQHFHDNPVVNDYRFRLSPHQRHIGLAGAAVTVLAALALIPVVGAFGWLLLAAGLLLTGWVAAQWGMATLIQHTRAQLMQDIVRAVRLKDGEHALDVGCGSGALTAACAQQLPHGKTFGIDVWDAHSGGGSLHTFLYNMHAEGVADRVTFQPMDARQMTFPAASFDAVVSSFAIHHMGDAEQCRQAAREIARVLKPGGRVALCDSGAILHDCADVLRQNGMVNVQVQQAGDALRFVRGGVRDVNILTGEQPA